MQGICKGSLVLTDQGLCRVESLICNLVNIYNGEWYDGTFFPIGTDSAYKATLTNHLSIEGAGDQSITIGSKEVYLKDIEGGRFRRHPLGAGWHNGDDLGISDEEWVVLGFVQGDGSTTGGRYVINIGDKDEEVTQYIQSIYSDLSVKNKIMRIPKTHRLFGLIKRIGIPELVLPERYLATNIFPIKESSMRCFLKGLYSANGSAISSSSSSFSGTIKLRSTNLRLIKEVFIILAALGIHSFVTVNKETEVKFKNGVYTCKESYDINIVNGRHVRRFREAIGFLHGYKMAKVSKIRVTTFRTNTIHIVDVVKGEPTQMFGFDSILTDKAWIDGFYYCKGQVNYGRS